MRGVIDYGEPRELHFCKGTLRCRKFELSFEMTALIDFAQSIFVSESGFSDDSAVLESVSPS
jgi:hypothetical protein